MTAVGETFLVTGSEGCIGSWVVKTLAEGGVRCVALDLEPTGARARLIADAAALDAVTWVAGDVAEEGVVERVAREHGATRIVHLAALQIPLVAADPLLGARVNVVGTVCVLEAARALDGQVRGVAYASSAAVFGRSGGARDPATLYGVFKVCNEDTARLYRRDFGVACVGLRPWAVFGPGRDQGLTAAPTHALKAAALGLPYRIPFGGRLDLQYAADVADAFLAAALAARLDDDVLNLRGDVVDVARFVSTLEEVAPDARGLVTFGGDELPIEAEPPGPDARATLGLRPTPLRDATAATLEHFRALARRGQLAAPAA